MRKRIMNTIITVIFISTCIGITIYAEEAVPTSSTVTINGQPIKFEAYMINDNNYFKLRDLACVLNGTEKQFSVEYDISTNLVSLTSNQPYISVGGEMELSGKGVSNAEPTQSKIIKDGVEINPQAYIINDNNYFKLRDIGEAFNFGVDWDSDSNTISINTRNSYNSEKKDDEVDVSKYYEQYEKYSQIELKGKINRLDKLNAYDETYVITAYFTDLDGNQWFLPVQAERTYGFGHTADYIPYIGKNVTITGIYEGFMNTEQLPSMSVYEIKNNETGESIMGIRKAEELVNNGEEINPDEPLMEGVANPTQFPRGIIEKVLNRVKIL